ncbi:MAG: hypothetical protein QM753_17755 [Thermomicrobiales bacterium]
MPGIIFTRYDRSPSDDKEPARAGRTPPDAGSLDRRRLLGGISALAVTAAAFPLIGGGQVAAQSTPASTDTAGPVALLGGLLQLVPASLAENTAGGALYYHADLAAQFAACGVDRSAPDWITSTNLYSVTASLALVSAGFQYAVSPDFETALGFQPLNVDRALEIGGPPNALSIYQGGLDRAKLEAAWRATGFQQVALGGGAVLWTLGEEGEIDTNSPIVAFGAGAFNNLLLLDDQTLLVARMGAVIRSVISRAAGDASVGRIAGVQEALAAFSPTVVSSIGLNGSALTRSPRPGAAATPVVTGAMPAISLAFFGVEAGARGEIDATGATPVAGAPSGDAGASAKVEVRLVTASRSDAETAAATASTRWETMQSQVTNQPFSALMTLEASGVSAESETVATLDFASGPMPGRWIQLVAMQDLAPFAPGGS